MPVWRSLCNLRLTCNMTSNKIHHISFHKPVFIFWHAGSGYLIPWLQSADTGPDRVACVCERLCSCISALDECSMAAVLTAVACLANRSASTAFCALLVSLVMGTSVWWTFSLCCIENCNFSLSPFPHSPPPPSLITPSRSPLAPSPSYSHCRYRRCCSRISSQCGCWTWEGMIPTGWQEVKKTEKKGLRAEIGRRRKEAAD